MWGREGPPHLSLFPGCEGTALMLLAGGLCGWGLSGQRPAKCRTGVAPTCPWRAVPSCLWRSRRPGRKKWRWAERGALSWRWRGGAGLDTGPAGVERDKIKHRGNRTLKDCVPNKISSEGKNTACYTIKWFMVHKEGLDGVLRDRDGVAVARAWHQNKQLWSLTMRMATKQASVVFQSPLAVAEAFPTSML